MNRRNILSLFFGIPFSAFTSKFLPKSRNSIPAITPDNNKFVAVYKIKLKHPVSFIAVNFVPIKNSNSFVV